MKGIWTQAKPAVFSIVGLSVVLAASAPAAESLQLAPYSCCDGVFVTTVIEGERVWQVQPGSMHLYFNVPSSFEFTPGSPLYVAVTYYDAGWGTILVQYDSTLGDDIPDMYAPSETHTRSTRVGTNAFVDSFHELETPLFAGRQNGGGDFRIALTSGREVPFSVRSVELRDVPFDDAGFQLALSRPWVSSYEGPTRDDVDASTLEHKVMAGYQGWYRAPNDLADRGWFHWCRGDQMVPETFNVDQWPDLSCFEPEELYRAGDVYTASGEPAYVFSSTTRETVRRHFRWMRKYNIDGAFLQRFAVKGNGGAYGGEEWVLDRVRESANLEGRIWAIEYDVTWVGDANAVEVLTADWKWLVDVFGILGGPRYAREQGKPVVAIWGLAFPHVGISTATADAVVDFFKNDPDYGGNYVIGGIPLWWRTMADWRDHFRKYDGALAWMPPDRASYQADFNLLASWGIDYFPHAWPGFSWANEMQLSGTDDYIPREGGLFLWEKIHDAIGSGATRLFIGMFDEYDEGTAIMPMSDDPPDPPPEWGRFITNDGRPSDWWMSLAGEGREMLLGHRPYSAEMPSEEELANRSNVGREAASDLGSVDQENLLRLVQPEGGQTIPVTFGGRDCRVNAEPGEGGYFYFDVDHEFANRSEAGRDVTIEVEYFDGAGELFLQYDGVDGSYTSHAKRVVTRGTGEWRTVRFEIADAYFGGREQAGADFRVGAAGGAEIHIDRIRVALEDRDCLPPAGLRRPGDINEDGQLDLSDAIRLLGYLFLGEGGALPCEGGSSENPGPGELSLIDWNGDRRIDISDAVSVLAYLFLGDRCHPLGDACVEIEGCTQKCAL